MGRTHAKIITGTSRRGCLCRFREAWGGMADAMASSYTAFANAFGCNVGCYRECNGGLRSHGVFAWVQAGAVILSESATKKKAALAVHGNGKVFTAWLLHVLGFARMAFMTRLAFIAFIAFMAFIIFLAFIDFLRLWKKSHRAMPVPHMNLRMAKTSVLTCCCNALHSAGRSSLLFKILRMAGVNSRGSPSFILGIVLATEAQANCAQAGDGGAGDCRQAGRASDLRVASIFRSGEEQRTRST